MQKYDKKFKEEAVNLSDDIGVKKASQQLGIPYYTISDWRNKRKAYGENASVGSGHARKNVSSSESEFEKEIVELRRANDILQEALCFFIKGRKK